MRDVTAQVHPGSRRARATPRPAFGRWLGPVAILTVGVFTLSAGIAAATLHPEEYLSFLLPRPDAPAPPAATAGARAQQDVAYLATQLPRLHARGLVRSTVHGITPIDRAEWDRQATALEAAAPTLDFPHLLVGEMRLVALLRDGETGISLPQLPQFPLATDWFGPDLRIVGGPHGQPWLLGARVVALGNTPIKQVQTSLEGIISSTGEWEAHSLTPYYVRVGTLLEGLGIIPDPQHLSITVVTLRGETKRVDMVASPSPFFANPRGMTFVPDTWRNSLAEQPYWWRYAPEHDVVYLKYNVCLHGDGFHAVVRPALAAVASHPGARLVIDLRGNGGGDSKPFNYLVSRIRGDSDLNRRGRIFGLIDRHTYSSATLNAASLRTETAATLVGEPTGDPANQFGNQRTFSLPNLGLVVHYSTRYFDPFGAYHHKPYVAPDQQVETSIAEVLAGRDPALRAALHVS